jgi:inosose dehydratase
MSTDNGSGTRRQQFSFGYQLITWDFAEWSRLEHGCETVAGEGFPYFELLLGDNLGSDFARRCLTLGPVPEPRTVPDNETFRRMALVATAVERFGIRPSAMYADGEWTNAELWPSEFAKVQVLTNFLKSCDAKVLACGGGLPELPGRPRDAGAYREFAERLKAIGEYTDSMGIRTVYHPHLDTFVESREQLDRLMDEIDTGIVGLCIDPAHFQVKRDDPVDIFRTYSSVIDYVHLKDCSGDESTLSGFDRYLSFCELGKGIIDVAGIVDVLLETDFSGVVTVELDYSETPDESCQTNAAFIRDSLGLALAV